MEEQKRDEKKKKFIVVRKRKAISTDKSTTSDQPKKNRYKVFVKRKPKPIQEVVEVEIQKELEIKPVQVAITIPKKSRRTKKVCDVPVKDEREVEKLKRSRRKKTEKFFSEEKPKTKQIRKNSSKTEENKKTNLVPVYDPDPFLETEVSTLNIARCLRKLKDIIKGKLDF